MKIIIKPKKRIIRTPKPAPKPRKIGGKYYA